MTSITLEPEPPAVDAAMKAGPVMLSWVCVVPARQLPSGWKVPVQALNRPAGSPLTAAASPAATSPALRPRKSPVLLVIALVIREKCRPRFWPSLTARIFTNWTELQLVVVNVRSTMELQPVAAQVPLQISAPASACASTTRLLRGALLKATAYESVAGRSPCGLSATRSPFSTPLPRLPVRSYGVSTTDAVFGSTTSTASPSTERPSYG